MITLAPELADANPGLERILSNLDLIDASWRQIVRDDFAYFRQHIRPGMLWGFWNEVVATELTEFYKDFVAGKRPKITGVSPTVSRILSKRRPRPSVRLMAVVAGIVVSFLNLRHIPHNAGCGRINGSLMPQGEEPEVFCRPTVPAAHCDYRTRVEASIDAPSSRTIQIRRCLQSCLKTSPDA
jgi:hypothetical protein